MLCIHSGKRNSRTLRQFTSDLALNAGMNLDWSMVAADDDARRKLYLARDVAVINADSSMLADIIKNSSQPYPGHRRLTITRVTPT